ncbi:tetratricopeptide repeat protein, partial [Kaarinaea lacus]
MMHWGSKLKMQELGSAIYRVSKKYISSFNLGAHCGVGVCTILLLATTFTVRASTGQANAATNITSAAPPQISTTASNKNIATVDGNALLTTGNFEQAVAYWRAVAKAKRQQGDAAAEAIALFNLAAAQRALGMQTRAIRALDRAWQLSKHLDEPQLQVNILSSLAGAYLYAGRIDKAKTLFIDARAKAMLIKDMRLEALILNDQGNLYAFEKSYDKALQAYQSSILLAQKIEENMLVARAQTNAALVSLQRRWPLQTKQYVLFAFDRLSSLPNSYEKAYAQ